jgi:uncharacterized membrane protein required for colicin V production
MTIDLILAGLVLVYGFFGLQSGAIRQLTHWLGLLVAYALARPAAARATPYAAADLGVSPHIVNVLLSGFFFFVFYALGSWLVGRAFLKAFPDRQNGRGDRTFGFVMGAAKGAVLLYALVSVYVFFEKPLTKAFGAPPPAVRNSFALELARRHDLFNAVHVPALAKFEKLLAAAKNPDGAGALAGQPELQQLLSDPKLKAVLQDGSLARALQSGDLSALKNDPRFSALLNDPKFAGAPAGTPANSADEPR